MILARFPIRLDVKIEKEFPDRLFVAGEKRYTSLIVQNLLENARKYNRPGGRIRVCAHRMAGRCADYREHRPANLAPAQEIFSSGFIISRLRFDCFRSWARFEFGARTGPIARRRFGLVRSDNDWTEFEVRFLVLRTAVLIRSMHEVASSAQPLLFRRGTRGALDLDDFLDRLDAALTVSAFEDNFRARLSGTIDLEMYHFQQPAPGLINSSNRQSFQSASDAVSRRATWVSDLFLCSVAAGSWFRPQ